MVDLKRRGLFSQSKAEVELLNLPWLQGQGNFLDNCTRCGQCLEVCETNVIRFGEGGFPLVDFQLGECSFCYRCADICPEPLFNIREASPWRVDIQLKEHCLALKNIDCRSCYDACEPMAINFYPVIGKVAQPEIQADVCTGCGACMYSCPVDAISLMLREN